MLNDKIFPVVLMAMMVSAALVYGANGDWRKCIYWLAGATITATVTF